MDEQEAGEGKQQLFQHALQVSQRASQMNFKRKYEKLVKIAKTYADLCRRVRDEDAHPFPPTQVSGPRIIVECPGCNTPCSCTSPSAFLKLLRHLQRRHPQYLSVLLADIINRYGPFIEFMKRKIQIKTRRLYVKKLRNLGHRKSLLN